MGTTSTEGRDLRLPSQEADHEPPGRRGPLSWVLIAVNAVGVAVVMLVMLVVTPLVAMGTGLWQIGMETRDTAVRPRPFVGARHGFPFLDPPAPEPPAEAESE